MLRPSTLLYMFISSVVLDLWSCMRLFLFMQTNHFTSYWKKYLKPNAYSSINISPIDEEFLKRHDHDQSIVNKVTNKSDLSNTFVIPPKFVMLQSKVCWEQQLRLQVGIYFIFLNKN